MENKQRIAAAIAAQTGLEADQLKDWLETPPDPAMGDYAFPCFRLAKTMRKAPPAIAAELAGSIGHIDGIASMEAKGGYLNFFADKTAFVRDTLNKVLAQGDSYGDSDLGGGRNVCVEYSSINIAKPFHIGHLPSTAIGNSLYRIYRALGYNVIGINHLGDWGTQFGKMIVAYKKWGDKPVPQCTVRELVKLYVRFHEEAEKHPEMNDEARAWFKKIESGEADYHIVEVMCCPGGCVNGGGQPIQPSTVRSFTDIKALRAKALYDEDAAKTLRKSHLNPVVKECYEWMGGEPGCHKAHELLHTSYVKRDRF